MLKDITLGQYYQADSKIHKLDPRVKLVGTIVYIISLFMFRNLTIYLFALLFLIFVIRMSKVPFSYIVRGLKAIVFLLIITTLFNLFLTAGKPIVTIWKFSLTYEGIASAFYLAVRLIFLIIGSSLMTLTTTPNQLTDGLERLLGPLKKIKVPVHEISMMMSIALRFIPILMEETDKIMKAQMARCADFESGNIIKKVKALIPLLVPLFISSFRRANDLAMAMEARCYQGGEGRTKMKPLIYKKQDYIAYAFLFCYLVLAILLGKFLPLHVLHFFVK
ncbi:MAG: energy-coupling factor transporter transmembrane component T [Lachnospiraceae bacterium]|nr:energy-coupling factor transporter transmembrane protein EcfT [Lachnospiraceae bacterium]MDD5854344.1 energy-coupling factor transporter transmembrane component T [Lachnospiraceae bacterium]